LDQLIDLLKNANGERELTKLVAENLLAFDSGFWLRLATRADAAQGQQEKQQLANLANVSLWPCLYPHTSDKAYTSPFCMHT